MATQIQLRRDSSVNWKNVNPILVEGEFGIELDTSSFKVGNGLSAWNILPYFYEYKIFSIFQSNSANWNQAYIVATTYQNASGSFATNTLLQSTSALLTPLTTFNSYKTNVASTTSTLLPTTTYQNASGVWQSTYTTVQANSASWEESAEIIPTVTNYLSTNNVQISSLNLTDRFVVEDQLYYTTDNAVTQLSALSGNYDEGQFLGRVKLSQNNTRLVNVGNTWMAKQLNRFWLSVAISSDGKYQSAIENGGRIYISSDYGNTWTPKESNRIWRGIAMSSDGKYQSAVVGGGGFADGQIYISSNYGNTWTAKESVRNWRNITISSDGKYQSATVNSGQIYISSNYGNTWTAKESVRNWYGIAISSDGKYQSATVENGQIYISSDYGNTWVAKDSSRYWQEIAMSSDGKYQSAVVYVGQIYVSSDYGNTWVAKDFSRSWFSIAMSSDGKYQSATNGSVGRIYISSDYGNTWTPKESNRNWRGIAMSSDGKYQSAVANNSQIYTSVADEIIDGNLNVTQSISSTGVAYASGGNSTQWNQAYNVATVLNTDFNSYKTDVASATASNINYVHTNFLPLTGGIISGDTRINNNLTIWGNLSASGTQTFANTIFSTTSALSVVHVGSGPAMWVGNSGDGDIASFYDIDQNIEILHVGGINSSFPNVGVKTSTPNKTFTVNGEISATSDITNTGKIYTTQLRATTIFTTGSGNVLIDQGNYRYNNDPTIILGANSDQHLRFRAGGDTNDQIRMTILSGGEVGIGTTLQETQAAGNGGLRVKNNLLVGSPTSLILTNGDFQNTTGLTGAGGNWFTGVPFGWTSPNASPTFSVWNGSGDYVPNISQLANTSGGSNSFRQNLGTLQVMSNVNVTFDYASTTIAPWSNGTMNLAIYDSNFNVLASNTYTSAGTYSLVATAVPAGTTIIVGFWHSSGTPALNNVTVTQIVNNALTVVGGISSSGDIFVKSGDSRLWNSAYTVATTYQNASGAFVKTVTTTSPSTSAVTTIVAVSAVPVVQQTGVLYIVV